MVSLSDSRLPLVDACAALRRQLTVNGNVPLSRVFAAWMLRRVEGQQKVRSLVNEAAGRVGPAQTFQAAAILGFAAEGGFLREGHREALRDSLLRQAGREAVIDTVPMAFRLDAVGILGIALGTKAMGDDDCSREVRCWFSKFLTESYMTYGSDDWQRCVLAAADQLLGKPVDLSMPKSIATADVRIALLSRGASCVSDQRPWQVDAADTVDLAVQESNMDLGCERAALRLAALEWLTQIAEAADEEKHSFIERSGAEVDVLHSGLGRTPPPNTLRRSKALRNGTGPTTRNQKYKAIDEALLAIAESRPRSQEEVIQALEGRVAIPFADPFLAARGWLAGFRLNEANARAWLSKRWAGLNLATLPRGPKRPKK